MTLAALVPETDRRGGTERLAINPLVSVVILTYNEEKNLPACLASLASLHAEVWVVDSGSTDATRRIAAGHGAHVVTHGFDNYATQRNWTLAALPLNAKWVLNLDADERLTPALVDEINSVLESPASQIDGYLLRKRTYFMGRWIKHGGHYPSYHLRLFKRGSGQCEDRTYDQHFVVDGTTATLRHDYIDVVSSSLQTWTTRHALWAQLETSELLGPAAAARQVVPAFKGTPIERRRWWRNTYSRGPLFIRAFAYWMYRYFFRLGFLDGTEGLVFHFLQGFWFRFLVDAMILESRRA